MKKPKFTDALKKWIKEIAQSRERYGYRRVHVLLRQECWLVSNRLAKPPNLRLFRVCAAMPIDLQLIEYK